MINNTESTGKLQHYNNLLQNNNKQLCNMLKSSLIQSMKRPLGMFNFSFSRHGTTTITQYKNNFGYSGHWKNTADISEWCQCGQTGFLICPSLPSQFIAGISQRPAARYRVLGSSRPSHSPCAWPIHHGWWAWATLPQRTDPSPGTGHSGSEGGKHGRVRLQNNMHYLSITV